MSFSSSRGSTPSSSPISIASRSSSLSLASSSFCSTPSACQPFSSSMRRPSNNERPSAYVSDDDLLGADDAPFMRSAPAPPRPAEMWLARPLLPPVTKSSRTSNSVSKPIKP